MANNSVPIATAGPTIHPGGPIAVLVHTIALCGIDRWLGGVHLEGSGPVWRWDAATGRPRHSQSPSDRAGLSRPLRSGPKTVDRPRRPQETRLFADYPDTQQIMRACLIALFVSCSFVAAAAAPAAVAPLQGVASVAPLQGVASVDGRPQANVVIWLEDGPADTRPDARQPVMDQRNLQFLPQVLAVRVGTTVRFPNGDRVFHNVFSFKDGKQFDLGLYPVGAVKFVRFDQPGVSRLFCNIHPKMAAYVVAVDSSYIATSDERGAFQIDAPQGTYTYYAWRAGGDVLKGTVTVGSGPALGINWP
jgi:plastocyanin